MAKKRTVVKFYDKKMQRMEAQASVLTKQGKQEEATALITLVSERMARKREAHA